MVEGRGYCQECNPGKGWQRHNDWSPQEEPDAQPKAGEQPEHFARCYQTLIEVWSAGVVHPKPAIDLHLEEHGVTVYIADDYEHLEAMLLRLLEKVRERRAADAPAKARGEER